MSLNKKKMVREIGRRTRIRNRDVQAVIEALIDVWTEELVSGGRIEIENFITLAVKQKRGCLDIPHIKFSHRFTDRLNKLPTDEQ